MKMLYFKFHNLPYGYEVNFSDMDKVKYRNNRIFLFSHCCFTDFDLME